MGNVKMTQANQQLRIDLKEKKISMWRVAEALGVSEWTLGRWLRHEIDPELEKRIREIADTLFRSDELDLAERGESNPISARQREVMPQIRKLSKRFDGTLNDTEVIHRLRMSGVSFYKYLKYMEEEQKGEK